MEWCPKSIFVTRRDLFVSGWYSIPCQMYEFLLQQNNWCGFAKCENVSTFYVVSRRFYFECVLIFFLFLKSYNSGDFVGEQYHLPGSSWNINSLNGTSVQMGIRRYLTFTSVDVKVDNYLHFGRAIPYNITNFKEWYPIVTLNNRCDGVFSISFNNKILKLVTFE